MLSSLWCCIIVVLVWIWMMGKTWVSLSCVKFRCEGWSVVPTPHYRHAWVLKNECVMFLPFLFSSNFLIEMLGMEPKYALVKPDERRGRFVMKEILAAGNFGRFDNRILSGNYRSPLLANLQRLLRDLHMIRYFPSECIWEPWFRIYHWWWRIGIGNQNVN